MKKEIIHYSSAQVGITHCGLDADSENYGRRSKKQTHIISFSRGFVTCSECLKILKKQDQGLTCCFCGGFKGMTRKRMICPECTEKHRGYNEACEKYPWINVHILGKLMDDRNFNTRKLDKNYVFVIYHPDKNIYSLLGFDTLGLFKATLAVVLHKWNRGYVLKGAWHKGRPLDVSYDVKVKVTVKERK